jgi:hypothetical protein
MVIATLMSYKENRLLNPNQFNEREGEEKDKERRDGASAPKGVMQEETTKEGGRRRNE